MNPYRGRRLLIGVTAIIASSALAIGCGSDDSSSDGASNEDQRVYLLQNVIFPYITANNKGAEKGAEAHGVDLRIVNANGSATEQISQINTAVAAGAKGIIIQAVDSNAVVPAIEAAASKGVCVAALAVPIGTKTGAVYPGTKAYVGWDEHYTGSLIAQALAKEIGGSGNVAVLPGGVTNGTDVARVQGLEDEWKKNYPGIRVVAKELTQYNPDKARLQVLGLIRRYGSSLKAVYVSTNPVAIAVVNAISSTPFKGKIAVGSIGGQKTFHTLISKGLATADVPEMPVSEGEKAVELVSECIKGDKTPVFFPEEKLSSLKSLADDNYTITESNAASFPSQW